MFGILFQFLDFISIFRILDAHSNVKISYKKSVVQKNQLHKVMNFVGQILKLFEQNDQQL